MENKKKMGKCSRVQCCCSCPWPWSSFLFMVYFCEMLLLIWCGHIIVTETYCCPWFTFFFPTSPRKGWPQILHYWGHIYSMWGLNLLILCKRKQYESKKNVLKQSFIKSANLCIYFQIYLHYGGHIFIMYFVVRASSRTYCFCRNNKCFNWLQNMWGFLFIQPQTQIVWLCFLHKMLTFIYLFILIKDIISGSTIFYHIYQYQTWSQIVMVEQPLF